MSVPFIPFCLIIVLCVIRFHLATEFQTVAELKGYFDNKYFWISFWCGIGGYILVAALPNKNSTTYENKAASSINTNTRQPAPDKTAQNVNSLKETDKKRLAYWAKHKEEHQALLQKKIEVTRKLNSTTLSATERSTLKNTLLQIDSELNRTR